MTIVAIVGLLLFFTAFALVIRRLLRSPKPLVTDAQVKMASGTRSGAAYANPARINLGRDDSDCHFDVVGEGSYQGALGKLAGDRLLNGEHVVFEALIVPEPDNPYDKGAIAVHAEGVGKIGYFSREEAEEWAEVAQALLMRKAIGSCDGLLIGGWERNKHIGARLALLESDEALERLGPAQLPL